MSEMFYTPVVTKDRSSGRYHVRVFAAHQHLVDERCNLDSAGAYDVMEEGLPEDVDSRDLCLYCFPPPEDDPVENFVEDQV